MLSYWFLVSFLLFRLYDMKRSMPDACANSAARTPNAASGVIFVGVLVPGHPIGQRQRGAANPGAPPDGKRALRLPRGELLSR